MAIVGPAPFHVSNAEAEIVEFACFRCMCVLVWALFGFGALVLFSVLLCCCVAFVSVHGVMCCFCLCVVVILVLFVLTMLFLLCCVLWVSAGLMFDFCQLSVFCSVCVCVCVCVCLCCLLGAFDCLFRFAAYNAVVSQHSNYWTPDNTSQQPLQP